MTARVSARKRRQMRNRPMIVTVDKEDFVVDVKREPSDAQTEAAVAEIHREDSVFIPTQICKGSYHRKNGNGTVLPITLFGVNKYTGGTLKTCMECRKANGRGSMTTPEIRKLPESSEIFGPPNPILIVGPVIVPQRWRITIVKRVEVEVSASDFLDAAAQAGDGEVVKVERLD